MSQLIELIQDDITTLKVDAIVNAANSRLAGGGGVDGAIHAAAGPELLKACQKISQEEGECPAGSAVITPGFQLTAKYVIHAVGPIWHGEDPYAGEQLNSVYIRCLELAQENECRSIAFPNISTGVYGFPKEKAANIVMTTIQDYFTQRKGTREAFDKVFIVCFDDENYRIYDRLLHPQNSNASAPQIEIASP